MPPPKTPLPELLNWDCSDYDTRITINQIITYLKELEEANLPRLGTLADVKEREGALKNCSCNIAPDWVHYRDCPLIIEREEAQPEKPELKETLLKSVQDLQLDYGDAKPTEIEFAEIDGYNRALKDVEYIINKVFRDNAN